MPRFFPIFCFSFFFSAAALAVPKVVIPVGNFKENVIDVILGNSNILDAFWLGDDGIECGEPTLELISVDYSKNKIVFKVEPAARAFSCEYNSHVCEISFEEDFERKTLVVKNSPVYPLTSSCIQ